MYNLDAYKAFKELKEKYPVRKILITDNDLMGKTLMFKNHEEFVRHAFKQDGIEVLRFRHNYDSLKGNHPELGVVFLASDSVILQGLEAHVLIGHNARYILGDNAAGITL